MSKPLVSSIPIQEFSLWEKIKGKRALISFDIELTARCNNNCRHCYINLPANHKNAKERELSAEEIKEIADKKNLNDFDKKLSKESKELYEKLKKRH